MSGVVVLVACGGVFSAAAMGQDCGSCEVIYSNPYVGQGSFGANAQLYEEAFEAYDVWLGDDFSTSADYSDLVVRSAGWCGNGCVSPALAGFVARIYDALPDDPDATLVMESEGFCFDGVETWSASFGDQVLPAGDYYFAFASKNEFGSNGLMYFWAMPGEGANGWQWFSGGDGSVVFLEVEDGVPGAPNAVIEGCEAGGCLADCDGSGELDVLDFVCFQGLFQAGDASADCDGNGALNVLDFVCFQGAFQAGCP